MKIIIVKHNISLLKKCTIKLSLVPLYFFKSLALLFDFLYIKYIQLLILDEYMIDTKLYKLIL